MTLEIIPVEERLIDLRCECHNISCQKKLLIDSGFYLEFVQGHGHVYAHDCKLLPKDRALLYTGDDYRVFAD